MENWKTMQPSFDLAWKLLVKEYKNPTPLLPGNTPLLPGNTPSVAGQHQQYITNIESSIDSCRGSATADEYAALSPAAKNALAAGTTVREEDDTEEPAYRDMEKVIIQATNSKRLTQNQSDKLHRIF